MYTSLHVVITFQAGSTALILASEEGYIDVVKALLAAGANVHGRNKVGGIYHLG